MLRLIVSLLVCACALVLATQSARSEGLAPSKSHFYYRTSSGIDSARIIHRYWTVPVVHPDAKIDSRIDPRLRRAATIAQERANARSKARCWRYVKEALVASGAISSYPKSNYASEAGDELVRDFGFTRLPIRDQFAAPLGSVLVYSARGAAGHVEIRTKNGFVSDFRSKTPSKRPLIGVYAKG